MSRSISPADYTDAEKDLVEKVRKGEPWLYGTGKPELDNPANGADWGPERTIRAEVICALVVGEYSQVHSKGVRILGARIIGSLDLGAVKIPYPFTLVDCFVGEPITLRYADALSVNLTGSHVAAILAEGLRTRGFVFLRKGFHAKGAVLLRGACVGGDLGCAGGSFENTKGYALYVDGATVGGDVLLGGGFHSMGAVRLVGAKIRGELFCGAGCFENASGEALNADNATVDGSVFLGGGFHAKGEVRLLGARIGGNLSCSGGTFENSAGKALSADGATVDGDVFLSDGFRSEGEVRLVGAKIADLGCCGGTFENGNGDALSVDFATVYGSVFLSNGFHAKGEVRLAGGKIGGLLVCSGGTFENANGDALSADGATVGGNVSLGDGFHTTGAVRLVGTRISGLIDDQKSWPEEGKLYLSGFVYERLAGSAPWRAHDWKDDKGVLRKGRLHWLSLQPDFRPQPYEQLIKVLKEMGHEQEAREVAIAKQQRLRADGGLSRLSRAKNLFLDKTIKYGYESWRAFIVLFVVWFFGTGMFCMAEWTGVMVPSEKAAYDSQGVVLKTLPQSYPIFHAPLYALDLFVPGIDMHQKSKWYLREKDSAAFCMLLRYCLFEIGSVVYVIICWILTLLGVGAVGGLIKPK